MADRTARCRSPVDDHASIRARSSHDLERAYDQLASMRAIVRRPEEPRSRKELLRSWVVAPATRGAGGKLVTIGYYLSYLWLAFWFAVALIAPVAETQDAHTGAVWSGLGTGILVSALCFIVGLAPSGVLRLILHALR